MPVSNKDFGELMYDLLPEMYRTADKDANPAPFPLKRFLQVASVGMTQVEGEIDGQQLLFDADLVPAKYLDPLGRMIGFNFPKKMTEMEKRGMLKNLPLLYKLKGSSQVFEVIARVIFSPKNTKATTEWEYSKDTATMRVTLLVQEGVTELEERMERFVELIEYFRPINVGIGWTLEVYYEDELVSTNFFDESDIDIMVVDDNIFGQHEYTGSNNDKPRLLNVMRLNTTAELYGILWEYYDSKNYTDKDNLDTIEMSVVEDTYDKLKKYLEESTFTNNKSNISGKSLLSNLSETLFDDNFNDVMRAEDNDEFLGTVTHTETDVLHVNDNIIIPLSELNEDELNDFVIGAEQAEEIQLDLVETEGTSLMYSSDEDEKSYSETLRLNYSTLGGTDKFGENFREEEIHTDILHNVENDEFSLGRSEDNTSSSQLINLNYSLNLGVLGSTMILSKAQQVISYNY